MPLQAENNLASDFPDADGRSSLPVAACLPSGLKATHNTRSLWPVKVQTLLPLFASQTIAI